jgi:hypothetical protein
VEPQVGEGIQEHHGEDDGRGGGRGREMGDPSRGRRGEDAKRGQAMGC